jgi:ComF family protein
MIKDFVNLLFPQLCFACSSILSDNEKDICIECRHNLPVTNFHSIKDNVVTKVFYGRVVLQHATSLLWFQKKGLVQQLLHNLKYRGHENIGKILGQWLGYELKNSPYYKNIDLVIPVPLHKAKMKKRGYNQVSKFGQEISKILNAEYNEDILVKIADTKTQVFKSRLGRWDNSKTVFTADKNAYIDGKHVLLVDDIITTGATIESCANALYNAHVNKEIKLSVASIAIA